MMMCDRWEKNMEMLKSGALGDDTSLCVNKILKDALPLIKELTEENESLTATVKVRGKTIEDLQLLIRKVEEENERLKGRNEHLAECLDIEDKYKDRLRGILLQFTDIVHKWGNKNGYDTSEISLVPVIYEANTIKSQIVADTVRKMQSEIDKTLSALCKGDVSEIHRMIDQIAKEMLEGEDERV